MKEGEILTGSYFKWGPKRRRDFGDGLVGGQMHSDARARWRGTAPMNRDDTELSKRLEPVLLHRQPRQERMQNRIKPRNFRIPKPGEWSSSSSKWEQQQGVWRKKEEEEIWEGTWSESEDERKERVYYESGGTRAKYIHEVELKGIEPEGLVPSRGAWEQTGADARKGGAAVIWEAETRRLEEENREMVEEFDQMLGDALIENCVEIMEYDEQQMNKLVNGVKMNWEKGRNDEEREGDKKEKVKAGDQEGVNNDLDREEVDWEMDEMADEGNDDEDWKLMYGREWGEI